MSYDKPIHRIAVVGTGVIGASWAAQYLARGFDVVATDPAPNAEANLRKYVDEAWQQLEEIGLSPDASRDRLSFTKDMKQALANHAQRDAIGVQAPRADPCGPSVQPAAHHSPGGSGGRRQDCARSRRA